MNQDYASLVKALNLPDSIAECATGRIQLPIVGVKSPAEWYGFPPVLIPVWSDGSGPNYIGIWKHWFTDRPLSFVKMYVGSGRMAIEIARTPEQLLCYMAMATISIDDGVEPKLEQFCEAVGIRNLAEIDAVSLDTGDDPLGFSAIAQFATELPLASTNDSTSYSGTFPTGEFTGREWWRDACSFEVPKDVLSTWPEGQSQPRWFAPEPKAPIFQDFLDAGDLHGAWMTLNSSGWSFTDAKVAITKLDAIADNPEFSLLARAWVAVADEQAGDY